MKNERAETVKKLEANYDGRYGEYMYFGGQVFVFKDGYIANKTLLIKKQFPKDHLKDASQKFKTKPVYANDSESDLQNTINDFKEEYEWYVETFKEIPNVIIPSETYSICTDPMGSTN
ncbi:MAG: hypothetical protein Fur003_2340 [Candidatus Dojkabacteria bacterium]